MSVFQANEYLYSHLTSGRTEFRLSDEYVQHVCIPCPTQVINLTRFDNLNHDKNLPCGTTIYNVDIDIKLDNGREKDDKLLRIRGGNSGLQLYSAVLSFGDKTSELLHNTPSCNMTPHDSVYFNNIVFDCVFIGICKDGHSEVFFFRRNHAIAKIRIQGAEALTFSDAKYLNTDLIQVFNNFGTDKIFGSLVDFD